MFLNTIKPAEGSVHHKKRVGRGIGSGLGKTCARGHKGQKSRAGGFHKIGFEGGQMPLYRRLPKRGFTSIKRSVAIRLSDLDRLSISEISRLSLIDCGLVSTFDNTIKIINSGEIKRAVNIKSGILVTAAAKVAITSIGGSVE